MKTLLTICALAAGAGLMATTETTEASHRCRGYGYGAGYRYTAPVFNRYPPRGYGFNRYDRGYHSVRRPYRDFGRPYGYGYRGYGRSGFSLQTPGFGIYVR